MDHAAAVALKLPSIWTDNIDAWFAQTESQFALRDITSDVTKYHYVIASLDAATARRCNALISRPGQVSYTAIKEQLLSKFGRTPFERAAAINNITSLGDRKPSELMDHLLCLLGDHTPDLMFRFHFFECLPDYVRATLSSSQTTDPSELAEEADRIFIAGRPKEFAVGINEATPSSVDRVQRNQKQRASQKARGALCYYHTRFGEEARKCSTPCAWTSNNSGNDLRGPRQ